LPEEDQGYLYVGLQLPNAASLQRTGEAARKVEDVLSKTPGVQAYTSIIGFSLLSTVTNITAGFLREPEAVVQSARAMDEHSRRSRITSRAS